MVSGDGADAEEGVGSEAKEGPSGRVPFGWDTRESTSGPQRETVAMGFEMSFARYQFLKLTWKLLEKHFETFGMARTILTSFLNK